VLAPFGVGCSWITLGSLSTVALAKVESFDANAPPIIMIEKKVSNK